MVRKLSVYLEEGEGNLARNFVWSSVGILCGSSTSISIFLITATEDSFECFSASALQRTPWKPKGKTKSLFHYKIFFPTRRLGFVIFWLVGLNAIKD